MTLENGVNELENISQEDRLKTLVNLINLYRKYITDIEKLEVDLSEVKAQRDKLQNQVIPEFMEELGIPGIELDDGKKVSVKDIFVTNITKDKQNQAYQWLSNNGFGDLIKHEVKVNFGKGETVSTNYLLKLLAETPEFKNAQYSDKESIHPQTLKATVKEQITKGNDLFLTEEALELLGIRVLKQAVIK